MAFKASKIKTGGSRSQNLPYGTALGEFYKQKDIEESRAQSAQNPLERFGIPVAERQDYELNPTFRNVHGVPITERVPELKKPIPESSSDLLTLGRTQGVNLKNNVMKLVQSQNLRKRVGIQNPAAHSNFLGNIAQKVQGLTNSRDFSEFTEFKSSTQQMFQQYRKYITGVQAGFPEIQMLTPIFPETTDSSSDYVSKALSALDTIKRNDESLLSTLGQRGFRTRELSESGTGIDTNSLRQEAIGGGINVSPIPGMNQDNNMDVEKERSLAKSWISKGKDAKKVADIFRSRTGQEL